VVPASRQPPRWCP